jgi:DNA-binding NarL/FixJ family response regulator
MFRKGRASIRRGSLNNNAKLTERQVAKIKICLAAGADMRDLATESGVCVGTIKQIKSGRRWPHVEPGYA